MNNPLPTVRDFGQVFPILGPFPPFDILGEQPQEQVLMEAENIVEEDIGEEDPEEDVPDLVLPPVLDEGGDWDDWHFEEPPGHGFAAHGDPHKQAGWINDDDPMIGVDMEEDGPRDSDIGETTSESEMED